MSRPMLHTRLAFLNAGVTFACGLMLLVFIELPFLAGSNTKPVGGDDTTTTSNLPERVPWQAFALVVLAVVSIVLGRLTAGRALRPLRVVTSAAREMSADNLSSRVRVPAAYQEFAELAETLDGMSRRLDESFTAQRQFVANASHELRTPLTVQRTLLQLALADPDATADTLRAACRDLLDLGRQQEDLIDALLTLATSYQPIEQWEPVDLTELTRKALEGADDSLSVHTTLAPAVVAGDSRLAGSLVSNLITNALRHNVPGGSVEVTTTPTGRLIVSNTGPLIPSDEVERLLQPFTRAGPGRTDQTDGHGLGLAIVAAIAQAHRARLTAVPRPGGGLHVTVDFRPWPDD